jgi:methyl-accepting chemotaxis protein
MSRPVTMTAETIHESIQGSIQNLHAELAPRLAHYGLHESARQRLQQIWPTIEPHLPTAIDDSDAAAMKMAHVAHIHAEHGDIICATALAHFRALLRGTFDSDYAAACLQTARQHAAIGLETRAHIFAGYCVLRAVTSVLTRKYWYSAARVGALTKLVAQAIMLDSAIMVTLSLRAEAKARETKRQAVDRAIAEFAGAIGDVVAAIQEASGSLATTSTGLQDASTETISRMASASTALGETSQSVDLAAPAAEQMSQSIAEIGGQASRGLDMTRAAVDEAERTSQAIRSLDEAATHIGSIVGLISKIAAQTNLLALNATIEAARAGEAGKGFAVVASEVKVLANQTSQATKDISSQVAAIQNATHRAVQEITAIAGVVHDLAGVATSIASAVEEQATSARAIAASMQTAAHNTVRTSEQIHSVEMEARRGAQAASDIQAWTTRLSARAQDLESKVAAFFTSVRAA